jgi:peroxiredoxin Q/BCP
MINNMSSLLLMFAGLLPLGSPAPDFTLRDDQGNVVRLSDLRGRKPVVLVFYPMDETPGCRAQLCEVRDHWRDFERSGVAVFGVNPGSAASHAKFRANHHFPFPLLVDAGKKVAALYGAGGLIVRRTVYGIDKDGRIVFAARGKPEPARVLAALTAQEKK